MSFYFLLHTFSSKSCDSYQLAFFTPGICPLYANSRKQILQIPYFLKYAWGRPQILQRVYSLVENLGLRCCFTFIDVLAMKCFLLLCFSERHTELCEQFSCLFISLGCCHDDNIHTSNLIDLIIFDLGEDQLLFDTESIIASSVK